ncbi:putative methyltransferase DDB_G0268948 [Parasteatoda tepidariorum]|uniref:Putative methyltransferase n=1 Tax=Parasteatoda tepidariorum TaxID=114398 RepID=A0A2L2Y1Q9_PARTP|nr:putative methyltransferase DDB_G0268948 [Parasteatoda tepidariorum]
MSSALFKGAKHAKLYSQFRPYPPRELIETIITYMKEKIKLEPPFCKAIDIGCGSGQSTFVLSQHFKSLLGVDVSEAQIKCAQEIHALPNIEYKVSEGDNLPVLSSSVQLVTLCQSIHWFVPLDNLYKEIRRILIPGGVVAAYGYWIPLPKTDDNKKNSEIYKCVFDYCHEEKLGAYWDKERYIVQNKYTDVNFPFLNQKRVELVNESESSLADYIGYLSTWSSYQKLSREHPDQASELLPEIEERLKEILGSKDTSEKIQLKLHTDYFMLIGHQ